MKRPGTAVLIGVSFGAISLINMAARPRFEAIRTVDVVQLIGVGYSGARAEAKTAYRKAIDRAGEELRVNPHDPDVLSNIANYYSVLGEREPALHYLQLALQYGHHDKNILEDAASVYNHLGETGLAVEWLGKAVQAGFPAIRIRDNPQCHNLENNPGYQRLTQRRQSVK